MGHHDRPPAPPPAGEPRAFLVDPALQVLPPAPGGPGLDPFLGAARPELARTVARVLASGVPEVLPAREDGPRHSLTVLPGPAPGRAWVAVGPHPVPPPDPRVGYLSRLMTAFATCADLEQALPKALEVILEALASPLGMIGYLDEEGSLVVPTLTLDVWDQCGIPDKSYHFARPARAGLWGRALSENRALVQNAPLSPPPGHLPLTRALAQPVTYQGETVGLLVVANKAVDYGEEDQELLAHLAAAVAPALRQRVVLEAYQTAMADFARELTAKNVELSALTRELSVARDRAESASRAKSQFLAGMSHELHTPLNAIIGFSQVLSDPFFGRLTPEQAQAAQDINAEGRHLLDLLAGLLEMARVEAGRAALNADEVYLPALVDQVLSGFSARFTARGLLLEARLEEELPLLEADQAKLVRTLEALLDNAVKFSDPGGRVRVSLTRVEAAYASGPQVPTRPTPEGAWALVEVADQGRGLDPRIQEEIFQPFFQGRDGLSDHTPGAGLGLALASRYAELHGGYLWAESPGPGQGSTFRLLLPLAAARPA
ncbi:MAG: GAF domain-containing sensor histidine kinase [Deltaproteobacteria bacterium]|nr:GAF domain-containing sensor histidine kinase [Deltaproteobacteria bacterium]